MSGIALPLLAFSLGASPAEVGAVLAANLAPYALIALPAGAALDRWNRRRVMIACDAIRVGNSLVIPVAIMSGGLGLVHLLVVALIDGALGVVFAVGYRALLPAMVPREQFSSARAKQSAGHSVVSIIGPAVGGLLFVVGPAVPFVFDAVSYACSTVTLALVSVSSASVPTIQPRQPFARQIAAGVSWVLANPPVRALAVVMTLDSAAFTGLYLVLIALAEHQGAPADAIGTVLSIGAIGGVLGSLLIGRLGGAPGRKRKSIRRTVTGPEVAAPS